MKFFLALLLVASCQAFSLKSAIKDESPEAVVPEFNAESEEHARQEFENALLDASPENDLIEPTVLDDTEAKIAPTYQLVERRGWADIWGKINDTLLKIIGHLHGKFHDLHDFLKTTVKSAGEKMHPHIVNIKTLAKDFIAHINVVSAKVARQALEFFKPFASTLGNTYVQLAQKIHERLQKITDANNATPIY